MLSKAISILEPHTGLNSITDYISRRRKTKTNNNTTLQRLLFEITAEDDDEDVSVAGCNKRPCTPLQNGSRFIKTFLKTLTCVNMRDVLVKMEFDYWKDWSNWCGLLIYKVCDLVIRMILKKQEKG